MKKLDPNIKTIVDIARVRAIESPSRLAYSFLQYDNDVKRTDLTYKQLDNAAASIAFYLLDTGYKNCNAILMFQPGLEFITSFLGCLYAGIVAVPIHSPRVSTRTLKNLSHIIQNSNAKVILCDSQTYKMYESLSDNIDFLRTIPIIVTNNISSDKINFIKTLYPEDLAFLQYTSGSTAQPKGVKITHANLMANERMICNSFHHNKNSTFVGWLPLYHDMGLIGNVLQPLYIGAHSILMSPLAFLQKPIRWLEAISEYKAHTSGGPNFAYDLCIQSFNPSDSAGLNLHTWKVAFNGSEPVRAQTIEKFIELFSPYGFKPKAIYPCYGLAEATLFVSGSSPKLLYKDITIDKRELEKGRIKKVTRNAPFSCQFISSGTPHPDITVKIINPFTNKECKPNQVGEIHLAGENISPGYWKETISRNQSQKSFIKTQADFIKTGDLGFFDQNELYITGRLKDLIIIRGKNYYPQDLEQTSIYAYETIYPTARKGKAAVFGINLDNGQESFIVLIEIDQKLTEDQHIKLITSIVEDITTTHGIRPFSVVLVKRASLPLTSSGKIKRQLCKKMYENGEFFIYKQLGQLINKIALPNTNTFNTSENRTHKIKEIIRQVLQKGPLEDIPENKNFLSLGIDSLACYEISNHLMKEFNVSIPITTILECQGIPNLLEIIDNTTLLPDISKQKYILNNYIPLSSSQQGLLFLQLLNPKNEHYTISFAFVLAGLHKTRNITKALERVVASNELLRAKIVQNENNFQFFIDSLDTFPPSIINGRDLSEKELNNRIQEQLEGAIKIDQGLLYKISIIEINNAQVLIFKMHHVITDFWSLSIFLKEFFEAYNNIICERELTTNNCLGKKTFGEFISLQREYLNSQKGQESKNFWLKELHSELPVLNLPRDFQRPPIFQNKGETIWFSLSTQQSNNLKALALNNEVTLFSLLLTVYSTLLHKYSGQNDIIIGSPMMGRTNNLFQYTQGYFVNTVAFRSEINEKITFLEHVQTIHKKVVSSLKHQEFPFTDLVHNLNIQRDTSFSSVFQTLFTMQKAPLFVDGQLTSLSLKHSGTVVNIEGNNITLHTVRNNTIEVDLDVMVVDNKDKVEGYFLYNSSLFKHTSIRKMILHFQKIIDEIILNPKQLIKNINLLTEEEEYEIITKWNQHAKEYNTPERLEEIFHKQAIRTPQQTAIWDKGDIITYEQLNDLSQEIADLLQSKKTNSIT